MLNHRHGVSGANAPRPYSSTGPTPASPQQTIHSKAASFYSKSTPPSHTTNPTSSSTLVAECEPLDPYTQHEGGKEERNDAEMNAKPSHRTLGVSTGGLPNCTRVRQGLRKDSIQRKKSGSEVFPFHHAPREEQRGKRCSSNIRSK